LPFLRSGRTNRCRIEERREPQIGEETLHMKRSKIQSLLGQQRITPARTEGRGEVQGGGRRTVARVNPLEIAV